MTLRNADYLLSQLLLTTAEKYPDRPALIFPEARLTYAQLSELSQRYARAMVGHGLSRGDHVGILAVNRPEYIALLFACMFSGTVAVLLNARFRVQELQHAATHCDLKWIFVGQSEAVPHAARLLEALPEIANADANEVLSAPAAPMPSDSCACRRSSSACL